MKAKKRHRRTCPTLEKQVFSANSSTSGQNEANSRKAKFRMSRLLKSTLAIAVAVCLLVSAMPSAFAAGRIKPVSIEIEDMELIYNSSEYNDWVENNYLYPAFRVEFENGDVMSDKESYLYGPDDWYYYFYFNDNIEGKPGVGTYNVKAYLGNSDEELTADFHVNVVESPVDRIEVDPIDLIYHADGYMSSDYDWETETYKPYYCYNINPNFTVYFKDGTSQECGLYGEVSYNGNYYSVNTDLSQGSENELAVGKHTFSASILGCESEFTVNILESPVEKIEVEPIELIYQSDGYWDTSYDWDTEEDHEFFHYYLDPEYKVYFKDGTIEEYYSNYVEYNGKEYYFSVNFSQNYDSELQIGENILPASFLGCDTEITVNIIDTPVKSVEAEPLNLYYHTDGRFVDSTFDEVPVTYFEYDLNFDNYTVNFKDGTTSKSDYDGFVSYKNKYDSLHADYYQDYDTELTVGSHKIPAEILGYKTEVPVNIIESPVEKVVFEDCSAIENSDGYWNAETIYDGDTEFDVEYFHYYLNPVFTVYFKDGTTKKSKGNYIYYNDRRYPVYIRTKQNYQTPLMPGKNKIDVSVLGYDTSYILNITKSPITNIEFKEKTIEQYTGGHWRTDYNHDADEYTRYYSYSDILPEYTIYFADGSTYSGNSDYFVYNNKSYYIDVDFTNETEMNPGVYKAKASVMGYTKEFEFSIVENDYEKLEIVSSKRADDGEGIQFEYKVTKKDGTSFTGAYFGNTKIVGDRKLEVEKEYNENGEYTQYANYGGLRVELPVPENNEFSYIEQNGGLYITEVNSNKDNLVVPSRIDGKPVIGISSMYCSPKTLTIPDSVVSLSTYFLSYGTEIVNLGSSVTGLSSNMFQSDNLKEINVSADNSEYASKDGVLYNKAMDTVIAFPKGKTGTYNVPDSVKNIDLLLQNPEKYSNISINFPNSSKYYVTEDGVTYNKDKTRVIASDKKKTGAYTMPDSVKTIADYAFANSNLSEVTISKNVTDIAYGAFQNCDALTKVTMPDSIKKIDSYAFGYCTELKSINLPSQLNSIGLHSLSKTALTEVKIPDSVTKLEGCAFYSCENLQSLTIGNGITSIPENCFAYTAISEVVIPEKVKKIGSSAFFHCKNLKKVTIMGDGLQAGSMAFSQCPLEDAAFIEKFSKFDKMAFEGIRLSKIKLGATVTELTYYSFAFTDKLAEIEFPDSLTHIKNSALTETKWLDDQPDGVVYAGKNVYTYKGAMPQNTTVSVKNGTLGIADLAFCSEKNLTKVTIPNTVQRIGGLSFGDCDGLKTVEIPASVTQIDPRAFTGCDNLTAVNVSPDNPNYSSVDGVLFNKEQTILIYCPKRADSSYEVPLSVRRINEFAFDPGVKTITIASTNVTPDKFAFGKELWFMGLMDPEDQNPWMYYNKITVRCPKGSLVENFAEDNYLNIENIPAAKIDATGDLSENGVTDITDVTIIQEYIAEYTHLNKEQQKRADVNSDGVTNINDVTTMQRILAGFE